MKIKKIIKPIDANTSFFSYKEDIEYVETVYTKAELDEARKEERERCARLCNQMATKAKNKIQSNYSSAITDVAMATAANKCAEAIRKMGEKNESD